ncbi:MAG: hypothetical protein V1894_02305 [Chloroflexota bacterium]
MWRKKSILIAVGVAVVAVGILGSVVLAQTESESTEKSLFARVAAILGIEEQKVEDAFNQAQQEMAAEAQDAWFKKLVEEGRLTQEQADQYKTWWQARPDLPAGFGLRGGFGFRGHGGFGFPGMCYPSLPSQQTTN